MEQQGLYKTALYCRLSQDDGKVGDSSSIQTQKAMLEHYAKERGYMIHDFYVDDGFSGTNFNRLAFQKLLKDIDNGIVNLVITKDLSRLGRDYIMTGYYTEIYFSNRSVRYIAINDNIDTLRNDNDIAPIVRQIFEYRLAGYGSIYIARQLTKDKVLIPAAMKAKKGDTRFQRYFNDSNAHIWNDGAINFILENPIYTGDMVNLKVQVANYKTKKIVANKKDKMIFVPNTHEGIITKEELP